MDWPCGQSPGRNPDDRRRVSSARDDGASANRVLSCRASTLLIFVRHLRLRGFTSCRSTPLASSELLHEMLDLLDARPPRRSCRNHARRAGLASGAQHRADRARRAGRVGELRRAERAYTRSDAGGKATRYPPAAPRVLAWYEEVLGRIESGAIVAPGEQERLTKEASAAAHLLDLLDSTADKPAD